MSALRVRFLLQTEGIMREQAAGAAAGIPPELVDSIERTFRRVMWLEKKRFGDLLHEYNLTLPQFLALIHLSHSEQGCAIGDLAGNLSQSNATMTGIVDRLEEEKLVHRLRNDSEDRRKVMVQVTPRGRHLLAKAQHSRREQSRRVLAQFSTAQLEELHRLLGVYVEYLEKEN